MMRLEVSARIARARSGQSVVQSRHPKRGRQNSNGFLVGGGGAGLHSREELVGTSVDNGPSRTTQMYQTAVLVLIGSTGVAVGRRGRDVRIKFEFLDLPSDTQRQRE